MRDIREALRDAAAQPGAAAAGAAELRAELARRTRRRRSVGAVVAAMVVVAAGAALLSRGGDRHRGLVTTDGTTAPTALPSPPPTAPTTAAPSTSTTTPAVDPAPPLPALYPGFLPSLAGAGKLAHFAEAQGPALGHVQSYFAKYTPTTPSPAELLVSDVAPWEGDGGPVERTTMAGFDVRLRRSGPTEQPDVLGVTAVVDGRAVALTTYGYSEDQLAQLLGALHRSADGTRWAIDAVPSDLQLYAEGDLPGRQAYLLQLGDGNLSGPLSVLLNVDAGPPLPPDVCFVCNPPPRNGLYGVDVGDRPGLLMDSSGLQGAVGAFSISWQLDVGVFATLVVSGDAVSTGDAIRIAASVRAATRDEWGALTCREQGRACDAFSVASFR